MSTMGRQNDYFIISYSKFLHLKFMDQLQSLIGSFSEFFCFFHYFWQSYSKFCNFARFFSIFCLPTQKTCFQTNLQLSTAGLFKYMTFSRTTSVKGLCFTGFHFSKCDQIRRKLRIWSHLLKYSLVENLIFCAVF